MGEPVLDDAADDLGPWTVAAPFDERVQVVLRDQGLRHAHVLTEEPDAADPPVAARLGQLVGVEREVRAMETADADVQDARLQTAAVVRRHGHSARGDVGQGRVAQRNGGWPAAAIHRSTISTEITT
jgi:hypothetical protein